MAYYVWLVLTLVVSVYSLTVSLAIAWLGVLSGCVPPLLNVVWQFDDGRSPSAKTRYPKLSFFMLAGLAWVLLTISEPGMALWLILGCLGAFLLHSYWAVGGKE